MTGPDTASGSKDQVLWRIRTTDRPDLSTFHLLAWLLVSPLRDASDSSSTGSSLLQLTISDSSDQQSRQVYAVLHGLTLAGLHNPYKIVLD